MKFASRLLASVAVFCASVLVAAADPTSVIIRVPTGAAPPAELPGLLAQWRRSGQVAQVLYLTRGRAEKPERVAGFAACAVLEFSSENSWAAWWKDAAPALPAGLIVRRADVLAHGERSPPDPSRSLFIVNTYTPMVSAGKFTGFVQGYVQPLYEAMLGTKHLVRYTAYLERGETGKADALNVLEYRDAAALAAMGTLKAGIREQLTATTPSYAEFDRIKDTLRIDGFGTFAIYSELPKGN